MLHTSTFSTVFDGLHNKSKWLRNMELHVAQLIVILFHSIPLTDLILHYFNLLYFLIKLSYLLDPSKKSNCKIQISAKKNFYLRYFTNFFLSIDNVSNRDSQYCGNLSKVVGVTICNTDCPILRNLNKVIVQISQPPILFLKVVGWQF